MEYLLTTLLVCHWAGDYTHLSTNKMLMAKKIGRPLFPILQHALVHAALMTCALLLFFNTTLSNLIFVFSIQLITHFLIDVWKGKMNVWFPDLQYPSNKFHWYIFGLDQLMHTLVIVIIVSKLI